MPSYFIIGTSRNDKLTERVLVEMNSLDTLRHLLALICLQIVQIPPTLPPTLLDIKGLIFSELT